MKLVMPGNNFNQRGWVHLPSDICRTIIGGGGTRWIPRWQRTESNREGKTQCTSNKRLRPDGSGWSRGGVCDLSYPDSKTRRGRVTAAGQICPTLTAQNNEVYRIMESNYTYRIRKLTPCECWRLMGWNDEGDANFHKAEAVNSNTQLYKQAGNSIVIPVLEALFRQMLA